MLDAYIGSIALWPGLRIPRGWALCDGSMLRIDQNQSLFSLLGGRFGMSADNKKFALPDLRGRAVLGAHLGPGAFPVGDSGGEEKIGLLPNQLPSHSHDLTAVAAVGTSTFITNAVLASVGTSAHFTVAPNIYATRTQPATPMGGASVGNIGSSVPHNNMQPFLAMNYIIAVQGPYPAKP